MQKRLELKTHQILVKAFEIKQSKNSAYSRSALARDLGVSPVFVTKILTGKKDVPPSRFKKLFQVLEMDISLQARFIKATILSALPSDELKDFASSTFLAESKMENYKAEPSKKFSLLRKWYHVPILTYLTCDTLDSSPKAIADHFGISEKEVVDSLERMQELGLIEFKEGVWSKIVPHSYFPTTKSQEEIRDHHRQMIQKAFNELSKTEPEDFDRRLITGFSIAVNPKNIPKAKKMIFDFLSEVSHTLSEGDCKEVYQCNVQLFPFGKKAK